jgi:hypothetical protein
VGGLAASRHPLVIVVVIVRGRLAVPIRPLPKTRDADETLTTDICLDSMATTTTPLKPGTNSAIPCTREESWFIRILWEEGNCSCLTWGGTLSSWPVEVKENEGRKADSSKASTSHSNLYYIPAQLLQDFAA